MISRLLTLTAWSMTPPAVWSPFHLVFMLIGILLAAFAAWKLRTRSEAFRLHLLFACGVFLAFSEVYKQLFLYYIENNRHYDWWYFPFQLCSLPMYLCLLLPFVPHKYQRIFCTFMYNYNLLGAVMVFVDPSGLMHPYWTLTLHGAANRQRILAVYSCICGRMCHRNHHQCYLASVWKRGYVLYHAVLRNHADCVLPDRC